MKTGKTYSIPKEIKEISDLYIQKIRRETEAIGVKSAYRELLSCLCEKDGGTQLSLVERTGIKAPTVSITLRKMEKEELVRRVVDENDLRKTHVYLTKKGRGLNDVLNARIKEFDASLIRDLTEAETAVFEKVLNSVKSKLI